MKVLAVSTGRVAPLFVTDEDAPRAAVPTGIRKTPRSTLDDPRRIALGDLGLDGDEQADHRFHGGPQRAVYAYPVEHYPVWRTLRAQATELDEELPPGFLGENLTVAGLPETRVWVGDVLVADSSADATPVRLRVTSPRYPCFKLNARMGFKHAAKMMVQSGFCGFYCQVLEPGTIAAGDTFRVVPGVREMTIDELFRLTMRGRQMDLL